MGCRPAAALLLLAAVGTLCCGSAVAAMAASTAVPSTGVETMALGTTARRLLDAFDATPGALQCASAPYLEPLQINTPGLYRFRIQALGTHQDSAREWLSRKGGSGRPLGRDAWAKARAACM